MKRYTTPRHTSYIREHPMRVGFPATGVRFLACEAMTSTIVSGIKRLLTR